MIRQLKTNISILGAIWNYIIIFNKLNPIFILSGISPLFLENLRSDKQSALNLLRVQRSFTSTWIGDLKNISQNYIWGTPEYLKYCQKLDNLILRKNLNKCDTLKIKYYYLYISVNKKIDI